jgi:hypothetical protein
MTVAIVKVFIGYALPAKLANLRCTGMMAIPPSLSLADLAGLAVSFSKY